MPTDERWRFDIHQRIAPREHATQGCHQPTGGIIGSSWFDLALLEECQLLTKEEVFCGQRSPRMDRKDGQTDQINHNWHDRSEAMCNGSEEMSLALNAQHGTLQNVTGPTTAAWQEFLRTTGPPHIRR